MRNIVRKYGPALLGLAATLAAPPAYALAQDLGADATRWHPGMTAIFSGFLCHEPLDAVHGLIAALDLPNGTTIEQFGRIEGPVHCFYSDGPVKFVGIIPHSKVFADPVKGRFLFVGFDIGGGVMAYGWVGEDYVSDGPAPALPGPVSL